RCRRFAALSPAGANEGSPVRPRRACPGGAMSLHYDDANVITPPPPGLPRWSDDSSLFARSPAENHCFHRDEPGGEPDPLGDAGSAESRLHRGKPGGGLRGNCICRRTLYIVPLLLAAVVLACCQSQAEAGGRNGRQSRTALADDPFEGFEPV